MRHGSSIRMALRGGILALLAALSGCGFFTSTETLIERAESQMAAHDYRGASIQLKNALQAEPTNSRARRLLAEVSLQLGDAPGASADLRRAVELGEAPGSVAVLAARIRLALGEFNELLTAIDTGEIPLAGAERSLYRARAMLGLQDSAGAFEELESLARDTPVAADVVIGLAQAEAGLGRFDAALGRLEALTSSEPDNPAAWLAKGTLFAARGQFDQAGDALEHARSVNVGQLTADQQAILLGTLVEVRLSRGDTPGAEAAQQELARLLPGAPITRFLGARIAMVRLDYATAGSELQRIVIGAPSFVSARFLLGAVSLAQGRLQQADLHLSQVVQNSPENVEARKLLAQVRMRLDRPGEAVQVLVSGLEAGGMDPQLNALLGAAQLQAGQGGQEIPVLEQALAGNPGSTPIHLNLAAAYLREGDARKALGLLNTDAARSGGILRDALAIGAIAAAEGIAAADREMDRILRDRPNDLEALNLAAGLLTQRAEFDRARALLLKALGQSTDHPGTLVALARLEAAAGNVPVAEGYLERVLVQDPRNTLARVGLTDLALRRGDRAGAIRRMEAWRDQEPQSPEPRFRLARLYPADNPEATRKVIDEAIAASPDKAAGHNTAGSIYIELGRYDQAVASFRSAVEATADQPLYWLNLAQAQLALDQRSGAREALVRALALRSDWIPAVGTAAMLDIRDGNREAALARVRSIKERRPRDAAVLALEGDVMLATQQFSDAAAAFDAAYALRPDASSAVKSYRARYQGKLGQATEPLTRWLALSPGDFTVRSILAEAYQLSGQRIRAIQEYEIVVRDGAPNAVALNNLAWLYQLQGDRRAIDAAQRAYQLAPMAAPIADTYGWILVQNGRAQEGLPLLEQAAREAPGVREFAYHRAAALAQLGRQEEARSALAALLADRTEFEGRADAQRLLGDLGGG